MQRFLGPVYRWRPSTTRRCRSSSHGTRARDRATPADVDHRRMEPERHPDTSARLHSRQKQEERCQNSDYSRQKKEHRGCVLLKQAVLSLGQSPAWRGGQRIYSAHRSIRTSGWICRNCRDKSFCSTSEDLVPFGERRRGAAKYFCGLRNLWLVFAGGFLGDVDRSCPRRRISGRRGSLWDFQ